MSWSWSFFPRRLRTDDRFLGLSREDRGLLRDLYDAADKWGRGPADRLSMAAALAIADGYDATPALERLATIGLVLVYSVNGRRYWQIDQYEDGGPYDLFRKRKGKSDFPAPPIVASPPVPKAPSVRQPSAKTAPTMRMAGADRPVETRRDETKDPALRSDPGAPFQGAQEPPSAPRSTDARAYEPPVANAPTAPLAVADGGAAAAPARSSIEELLAGDVDRWETYNGTQKQQDAHAFLRLLAKHRPVTQTDLDAIYMRADKPPKELGYTGTHKALAKASLEGWPGWTSKDPLVSLMALFEQERANGAALARQAMEHVRARLEKDVETSPEAKVVNPDDAWKLPPPDSKAAFARMRAEILAGKGR